MSCIKGGKVTLVAFVCFFLQCAFSNASSSGLPQRMYSYTGYICLAFLHCAFSNVSSNCLPETVQSRTFCICHEVVFFRVGSTKFAEILFRKLPEDGGVSSVINARK